MPRCSMESFPPGQIRILTCLSSSTFICLLTAQWPLSTSPHRVLPTLRTSSPQKMTYKQSPCTLLGPLPHAPLFSLVPYSANSSNLKTLNSEFLVHWNHHLMLNFISLFSGLVNIPLGKKKKGNSRPTPSVYILSRIKVLLCLPIPENSFLVHFI